MATEIEKLQRAKLYIEKLANGIDPITDSPVGDNDCVNNVRIARCFFYISGILDGVIQNGGYVGKKPSVSKQKFNLTAEQLADFQYSEIPITISEITNRINAMVKDDMTKLKSSSISSFLVENGILEEIELSNGKKRKVPTQKGSIFGITTEVRIGTYGPYHVNLYNDAAQHCIIDNMDQITEINNRSKRNGEQNGSDSNNETEPA